MSMKLWNPSQLPEPVLIMINTVYCSWLGMMEPGLFSTGPTCHQKSLQERHHTKPVFLCGPSLSENVKLVNNTVQVSHSLRRQLEPKCEKLHYFCLTFVTCKY